MSGEHVGDAAVVRGARFVNELGVDGVSHREDGVGLQDPVEHLRDFLLGDFAE